jgi:hypothetical protein
MRIALSLAVATILACSGENLGQYLEGADPDPKGQGEKDAAVIAPDSGAAKDAAAAADSSSSSDAGADAPVEASTNAFTGAPAYTATLGPSARKPPHPFPNDNPRGQACLNCHGESGPATRFSFGGTVYTSGDGTTPAPRVEVRLRDANGKALSAYTDNDGNFFFKLDPDGDFVLPAQVGARNAQATQHMLAPIAGGNCNGCHSPAGGAPRIHVP